MRILVAEDEKGVSSFIQKGLEEEQYTVDCVENGVDALEYAIATTYDLIITDVLMPKMDGLEFCSKLRAQGIHTPVLMLTAKIQVKDKVNGLDAGADDYLTKPFSFDEFLARVRAL
ncbi:MAG: response regulator, partial [SAR324 cluster bacterium]|nr:response regulator [SAR324 cluster bacterium]